MRDANFVIEVIEHLVTGLAKPIFIAFLLLSVSRWWIPLVSQPKIHSSYQKELRYWQHYGFVRLSLPVQPGIGQILSFPELTRQQGFSWSASNALFPLPHLADACALRIRVYGGLCPSLCHKLFGVFSVFRLPRIQRDYCARPEQQTRKLARYFV